jgi:uncharacterized membrane protein
VHLSRNTAIIAGILILTFAITLIAYPYMPDRIASHWDLSGEVNGYMSKFWGLFLVPLLSAGLTLLFLLIPRIDPLRANIREFRAVYDGFIIVFLLFLLYVQVFIILWNAGIRVSIAQVLSPAIGVLYYAIGILIGKARMNWFIGIRTPWTLSSERVWEKTHALGGKLFRLAGVLAFLGLLFPALAFYLILVPVLFISGYLVVYSYVEYQKVAREGTAGA